MTLLGLIFTFTTELEKYTPSVFLTPPKTPSDEKIVACAPSSKVILVRDQSSTSSHSDTMYFVVSALKDSILEWYPTSAVTAFGRIGSPVFNKPSKCFKCT